MNIRRLFSYVLLACVCLSGLFSSSLVAHAKETNILPNDENYVPIDPIGDYAINTLELDDSYLNDGKLTVYHHWVVNGSYRQITGLDTFSNNQYLIGTLDNLQAQHYPSSLVVADEIWFSKTDGSKLFDKSSKIEFTFTNVANYLSVSHKTQGSVASADFDSSYLDGMSVFITDINGVIQKLSPSDYSYSVTCSGGVMDMQVIIESSPYEVYRIILSAYYNMDAYPTYTQYASNSNYTFTRYGGFMNSMASLNEEPHDEKVGLLKSIIQIVTKIKDGVINLPSSIASSVKGFFDNVVNSITSMASNITNALVSLGNFIIDGIKGLFVPDQEDITDMKDDWENLLSIRFGALYEVVQLCVDYANSFNSAASVSLASGGSSTITIPVVTVPLGEVSFEFGGWEVDLIPSGFEYLIDTLKLMVSVCATILFVNGLRNKFERLVER